MQEEIVVPFDPDFDRPSVSSAPNVFDLLGARRAFLCGFVLSLLVLMSIGFLVVLFGIL